jgi:septum formation protein
MHFILASASPRRLSLLKQINLTPDSVVPADINENPIEGELPRGHALRLAGEKCQTISQNHQDSLILAADTVVGVGRRILPKAETIQQAEYCLNLLSGRSHRVFTGIAVYSPAKGLQSKVVETRLKFKRLSLDETRAYLASNEWDGKAGGYGIQGYAESFIESLSGSYSNVVGLPLLETRHLLQHHGLNPL